MQSNNVIVENNEELPENLISTLKQNCISASTFGDIIRLLKLEQRKHFIIYSQDIVIKGIEDKYAYVIT